MIRQYLQLARMLADRRVTSVPRSVLGQLAAQGRRTLPPELQGPGGRIGAGLKSLRFMRRWLAEEMVTRHHGQWVINSFLPPFPGPAYDRMFTNLLSGRRLSPVSAFLAVTAECPYHCWHCSYKNHSVGALETVQWQAVIQSLHGLGASIIGFTGGEPCSRDDLPSLVQTAAEGGASAIVFSSGACVTPGLLTRLRDAGLWSICISLDHHRAEEHDRLRGAPGAYAQALEVLRHSVRLGLYTMVGAVGSGALIRDGILAELYRVARECGVHELRIVEPMPCGRLSRSCSGVLLNAEEVRALRRFHVETNRAGRLPKVCAFNQIESPELFGCGAGTQHLFIDAAGEVCPCDFTGMSFGNVCQEPLAGIWTRMSKAMGNPRRHCFIQRHHHLVEKYSIGRFPLPVETSLKICAEAGREELPDYFQTMLGRRH
jgi:MoaA/NifB/PqqE/SkfB family radical SAM enzyme